MPNEARSIDNALVTARESQVLEFVASGMTNTEIAQELSISVHAVKFHLASTYRKLNVHNRTEAVVRHLQSTSTLNGGTG